MAESQATDPEEKRTPTVAELAEQVHALQSEVRDANQSARTAKTRLLEVREELNGKDCRIDELEERVEQQAQTIEQLRNRTGLLENVKEGGSLPIEKRAAILIQVLHNNATDNEGKAALDYKAAEAALGGSVNRSNIYRTMDKAEDLVDNSDLVWKVKEDKSSQKNTRLVMDLSAGDVPTTVAGKEIVQRGGN